MNKDKRNNIQLLGTLNNADESGIIANANQVYDANEDKSTQDVSKEHTERIKTLEDKENSMQTTLENITKTGEASAASNVTYNHSNSKLDATNVQQAVDEISTKTVFDISAYHATGGTLATYDNLEDALGTNGKNIPQSLRKGGMSVKFVQSSDNKYVQYRLMNQNWSITVSDWQGVDNEPTAGSDNLVKSKGVYDTIESKIPLVNEDGFHVIDENINIGMKYDEDGLDVVKVSSHFVEVLKALGISVDDVMSSCASLVNEDGFFIADESLNVGIKVDSDGIHAKNILEYEIVEN